MKKILFYPGTFNPPHLGHVAAVIAALRSADFDEVWIMPSGKRLDKEISTSIEDRKNLGSILVKYLQTIVSVPVKLISTGVSGVDDRYTHELILELKSESKDEIYQLCGIDGFMGIKERSIDPDEKFVLIKRPGYEFPAELVTKSNLLIVDEVGDMSSTKIRQMVKNGDQKYKEYIPAEVAAYIEEKGLYL